ncbi:MAG: hypothetical protein AAF204_04560 [Pseudomonadota bacterium]
MLRELDNETLELANVIATATPQSALIVEAAASETLEGNFSDRDPVMPQQDVSQPVPTLNNEFTPS